MFKLMSKNIMKILLLKFFLNWSYVACAKCTCCKSGNFRENFNFGNNVITHILFATLKIRKKGPGLPISVNDRVILALCEEFNFWKLRICQVYRK